MGRLLPRRLCIRKARFRASWNTVAWAELLAARMKGILAWDSLVTESQSPELRRNMMQEPNYAQAFKFLEDSTEDGADSLYGCIWDMAILEFAMSLHTKRGEVARRQAAKHCIWQLELNTNNDEEILNEAANVRRAMFLRSLSAQFF